TKRRQAMLLRAKQIAGSAHLEIKLGERETIRRLGKRREPLPTWLAQFVAYEHPAKTGMTAPPYATAQLVQLREAKPLCSRYGHHRGIGYVNAHFNHRRAY